MSTYLKPIYDTRKSFYYKAEVIQEDNITYLKSYGTIVARIETNGDQIKAYVNDTYSNTTLRHIKEFLLQNNFKAVSKKQILEDYSK